MSNMMNTCEDIQKRLVEYIHDELPKGERQRISNHLESCESCAKAERRLREADKIAQQIGATMVSDNEIAAIVERTVSQAKAEHDKTKQDSLRITSSPSNKEIALSEPWSIVGSNEGDTEEGTLSKPVANACLATIQPRTRRRFFFESAAAFVGAVMYKLDVPFLRSLQADSGDASVAAKPLPHEMKQRLISMLRLGQKEEYVAVGKLYKNEDTKDLNYHPDNLAISKAIMSLSPNATNLPKEDDNLLMHFEGNILIFGGPLSTPLTRVIFEYEAAGDGVFLRPEVRGTDALIPVPYYQAPRGSELLTRIMQGKGPVAARRAWRIESSGLSVPKTEVFDPRPGKKKLLVKQTGERLNEVGVDYLLITRIPNFLSPSFQSHFERNPNDCSYLSIFEGCTGIGTRGVIELTQNAEVIRKAFRRLQNSPAYQMLFKISDVIVDEQGGFQRGRKIELIDAFPLQHELDLYMYARGVLLEKNPELKDLASGSIDSDDIG